MASTAGWAVVGVPSSAAAHSRGLEKAPAALRAAGLLDALAAAGVDVRDDGDLPAAAWRAHRAPGEPNDAGRVIDGLRGVRRRVDAVLARGERALVLGGECTVTLGVVDAVAERHPDVALVYVDGGQDLQLPPDHPDEPVLDAMGVAHLLDLPGAWPPLAAAGHRRPLLRADRLVYLGYSDDEEDVHGLVPAVRIPAAQVLADPEDAARRALAAVGGTPFVLHLDVDVLDFLTLPVADVPTYGRGLVPATLDRVLRTLGADPGLVAMTCVEVNPDHADEAGLRGVVRLLAGALAAG
ncbi:arginase family protein [Promicromonospora sp. NPDC019610]|uniref:arginase family protein n=1 Tax=Promicromonospora sp. NPDC019610 TaxID=3364405 RepID=UPI003795E361